MLNPIEEAKFAELREKCREMKIPMPPEIMIGLKVHDKNGVLVFDDVQRGHSWNRNYYNMLLSCAMSIGTGVATFGAGYLAAKEIGTTVYVSANYGVTYNAASGSATLAGKGFQNAGTTNTQGIIVGTDATAFSSDQHTLIAPISNGTSAGTFSYVAQKIPVPAYTAGTKTWKTSYVRHFNNNSGGSITVRETGLAWYGGLLLAAGDRSYLLERSVLGSPVAVANGAQLTVTYEISMNFSAID